MHPVNLIAKALPYSELEPPPCEPVNAVCAVTGECGPCVPRKELLGKSFTNLDLLKAPASHYVNLDTWHAMKHRPTRASSWLCTESSFTPLRRIDVRPLVLKGVSANTWAGYVTTSYKKHGSLRAVINHAPGGVWAFDETLIDCRDLRRVNEWYGVLLYALMSGIGRSILETLDCPPFVMAKVGLSRWMTFEAWARDKVWSPLYSFLVYLLPSQEELKNIGCDAADGITSPSENENLPIQSSLFHGVG